jgi:hypothetical protein
MAFRKSIQTLFGVYIKDAYHRVEGLQLVGKDKIAFQVRSSLDGVKPHFGDEQHECAYALDGDNPIKQAYAHLKTLPEFDGAADC